MPTLLLNSYIFAQVVLKDIKPLSLVFYKGVELA
mgnify:CR=1 FL=1